jgi:hypothetical protein
LATVLLIDAIAVVETRNLVTVGDHGQAFSKFQIHKEVWQDVHRRFGLDKTTQFVDVGRCFADIKGDDLTSQLRARNTATCHVVIIEEKLLKQNLPCTAENIYAVWNLGWDGFKRRHFNLKECPMATRKNAVQVALLAKDHVENRLHD